MVNDGPNRSLVTNRSFEVSHVAVPSTPAQHAYAGPEPPFFLTALRKRWRSLLICLLVSGLVAAGVAKRFDSTTVQSKCSLLNSSLPKPPGPPVYKEPSPGTYSLLFASHRNLRRLIEKHDLQLEPQGLEGAIDVKNAVFGSSKMDIIFTWYDKQQAIQLLDEMVEIFIEDVVRRRLETIDTHIRHAERMLLASTARVDEAAERLRAYQQREGDAEGMQILAERELNRLSVRVESTRTALDAAEFKKLDLETELSIVNDLREQITNEYSTKFGEMQKTYQQQLITEVRGRYEHALKEYGPKSSARLRLKKLGPQLDALARAKEEQNLAEWTAQLMELDAAIRPPNPGGPDPLEPFYREVEKQERELEQIASRQRELQVDIRVNDQAIERLKNRLATKETELRESTSEVSIASDDAKQLEEQFQAADHERKLIQQQLGGLRQLEQCRLREFSIANPTYIASVKTNTRKLFVLAVFFVAMVLSSPIFVAEYFANRAVTVEKTGRELGLPVLARGSLMAHVVEGRVKGDMSDVDTSDVDALRLLALRIQQSITQPGSTVLFSGLGHKQSTFPLLCGLARCFSERDERVLILDAGKSVVADSQQLKNLFGELPLPQVQFADSGQSAPANGASLAQPTNGSTESGESQSDKALTHRNGPKGLSDYLSVDEMDPAEIIVPTRFAGVDCICGGSRPFPVEGLATRRMSDIFDRARKQYGLVLVAGPPSDLLADLQMLAARADGILFTVTPGQSMTSHSQKVLQEMMDLDSPIIGIVG